MKKEDVYEVCIKEEFEVPDKSLIYIENIVNEAHDNYKKHKAYKVASKENPKSLNFLKASYASGLRRTIIKEYRLIVIYSMLDKLINETIPIKSLNEFSLKYFGTPMNNNDIYGLTSNEKYSKKFIKYFKRGNLSKITFNIDESKERLIIDTTEYLCTIASEKFNNKGE